MSLWACSGPEAPRLMAENASIAQTHALVAAGLCAVAVAVYFLLYRAKWFPLVCLGLLLVHPAWTVSERRGDCGFLKAGAAQVITVVCAAMVLVQCPLGLRAKALQKRLQSDAEPDAAP
jgi:hypothetical protein